VKLTNNLGLPDALVRAISNDSYYRPEIPNYFSCTELLQPPRQRALKLLYKDEIVEDASERIWSLLGQAAHVICERGNVSDLVEKRFYIAVKVEGVIYTVGAQIDNLGLEDGALRDYKVTSAYKIKETDPNWTAQLNIQAELLRQNDYEVNNLGIIAILRDHKKAEAMRNPVYPQVAVAVMPIEMWSSNQTLRFIEDRIRAHVAAERALPICTSEERWADENTWALMKSGRKSAVKIFDDEAEAQEAASVTGFSVQFRPGQSRRCQSYCVVSKFCEQYKNELKQGEMTDG